MPKAATAEKSEAKSKGEVVAFQPPRLPFHQAIEERFDVDKGAWKVLVEAVFPSAKTIDSVVMALAYCKRRGLDPFKRVVHIVPMYDKASQSYVETVWPGIAELRTTAFRTGQYAGCDATAFGDDVTMTFSGTTGRGQYEQQVEYDVTFPEWAQVTVYRVINGAQVRFVGPKVYWLETYATVGRSELPNEMWKGRPRGQLEKCAEAAALRKAFPEEIGNDLTAEEMAGQVIEHDAREMSKLTPPPAPSVPVAPAEPIVVEQSKQGQRQGLKEAEAEADDAEPFDSDGWREDVVPRLRQAETEELLDEIWESDVLPRRSDAFPPDFAEATSVYREQKERLTG